MLKCKECGGAGFVDRGVDSCECTDCQPDLLAIKSVIAASDDEGLTAEDKEYRRQFKLLLKRYEELVKVLEPADWQTPLSRAQELRDNLVVTMQIKKLVSHS
jgi:hypothetical protein